MSNWGLWGGGVSSKDDVRPAASTDILNVTASATANTMGSWSQLIASTPRDGLLYIWAYADANIRRWVFDVGFGAAGSEVVVLPNLLASALGGGSAAVIHSALVPLFVPKGTRVAVRCQCDTGSSVLRVAADIIDGAWCGVQGYRRATTYGVNPAASGGTEMDGGGTSHTKGSYVELSSTTSAPIRAAVLMVGAGPNTTVASGSAKMLIDVAVGAAGSETIVLADQPVFRPYGYGQGWLGPFSLDIPSGVRLSARMQASATATASRYLALAILGLD